MSTDPRRIEPKYQDIVFSYETKLGVAAMIPVGFKCCLGRRMGLLRPKDGVEPRFLIYAYLAPDFQKVIHERTYHGSTVDRIPLKEISDFPVSIPNLIEQKAIASVLSSLDDKIDLLHRQNKTLEAMAETLFRQWFAEEAKDDWNEAKLADVCSVITKGTTPTTLGHQFIEKGVNFIKVESITDSGDFIFDKFAQISEETHQFLKRSIIESGDVLCSIAGTIGRTAIVDDSILPANTNQAIAILRIDCKKCLPEFVYLFLKSTAFREIMSGKIVHAVQPNLSLGEIGNTSFLLPPENLMRKFEVTIRPIFEKKKINSHQIHTLETLRDTLLPKLMSGEVRVDYP
ncbi:restriction endonuclease subunit S [Nitrosomonas ureae]|uniref:Type I restriction enzyme S subunit n=1 Tax=Nitrosomonas ureae TaxID=44577 RepID=A0A2T5I2Z9_9PROT|nr:restriction endonuclease subunit S [Nitrosomonas ureae]PTQ78211.1 type I restriction enzyme S subunit [Nitrosomonas ureae]